jgi:hypothetical protein
MKYRLATPKDFILGWRGLSEICGPIIATLAMLILVVTYPLTGWIKNDDRFP